VETASFQNGEAEIGYRHSRVRPHASVQAHFRESKGLVIDFSIDLAIDIYRPPLEQPGHFLQEMRHTVHGDECALDWPQDHSYQRSTQ
jgi:hypothetical protein